MADTATSETTAAETSPVELPAKLEQLKASATKEYSLKNYDAAAELYSEAAQVQDELHGEMSIENADLLYQYGRCLYHVAVSNSDVLGGKVASAEEPKRKKRKVSKPESSAAATNGGESGGSLIADAIKDSEQKMAEEIVETAVEQKDGAIPEAKESNINKPYFQIMGDENFTDSEDEDGDDNDGQPEEEEDDFATAYEILDMARVLLSRKVEALHNDSKDKGKASDENSEIRQVRERLADTHDLQAEISLENERFQDAINDTRDSLQLKMQLYPEESSLIAEAHFKLSLALEFASVTSTEETPDGQSKVAQVDEEMRKEAASEMELAIASCNLRVAKEEASLASLDNAKAADLQKTIADVKEMIGDMKQRLEDLRKPAVSLSAMQGIGGPAGAPNADEDPTRGVLGSMLGESKVEQAKRIHEATQNANDLTSMIKKKKPKQDADAPVVEGKGKRKAADDTEANGGAVNGNGKKVKFDADVKTEDAV